MSKLYKLKKWLTIEDATKYLSKSLGEEVTEADILRLALDRHLTLSIDFVNKTYVRKGKVVHYPWDELTRDIGAGTIRDDLKWHEWSAEEWASLRPKDSPNVSEKSRFMIMSLPINDEDYITLEDNVVTIDGIWDLPMIGNERLDIEHRYQYLTGGPAVTLQGLDGAFVSRGNDVMCQLQEDFDDNEYQKGSKAQGQALEQRIAIEGIDKTEADKLRAEHEIRKKEYREYRKSRPAKDNYFPAGGIPEDAVFVVRMEALKEFEQSIADPSAKGISTRERDTLYKIIIGMAVDGYGYDPKEKRSTVARDVSAKLDALEIPVSDDTVRKYIKEAEQLLPPKPA